MKVKETSFVLMHRFLLLDPNFCNSFYEEISKFSYSTVDFFSLAPKTILQTVNLRRSFNLNTMIVFVKYVEYFQSFFKFYNIFKNFLKRLYIQHFEPQKYTILIIISIFF